MTMQMNLGRPFPDRPIKTPSKEAPYPNVICRENKNHKSPAVQEIKKGKKKYINENPERRLLESESGARSELEIFLIQRGIDQSGL